jgi:predicted membrane protein
METNNKPYKQAFRYGIMASVLLILAGGVLLGINLGYIPESLKWVCISWQMLLVLIGILSLCKRDVFTGLFLIFVGALLLVPKLSVAFPNVFPDNFVQLYWPLFMSIAGFLVLFNIIYRRKRGKKRAHCVMKNKPKQTIDGDFFQTNTFSKGEYVVSEAEFKGGTIQTTFGVTELDFRKTSLPEGDTYLDITAVFSGVILHVPEHWKVISQMEIVFSGIADKRYATNPDSSKRLILVGSCVFSGCEIKN